MRGNYMTDQYSDELEQQVKDHAVGILDLTVAACDSCIEEAIFATLNTNARFAFEDGTDDLDERQSERVAELLEEALADAFQIAEALADEFRSQISKVRIPN